MLAKFGIGQDAPDAPQVGGLAIMLSEPRLYFMDVNGHGYSLTGAVAEPNALATCLYGAMYVYASDYQATEVAANGQQFDESGNIHRCARGTDRSRTVQASTGSLLHQSHSSHGSRRNTDEQTMDRCRCHQV